MNETPTHHLKYRPEIDGLRAVAVVVVILFHAGLGCPGGFVGVDVFFVISGFLITSLIWKDLERGRFTFGEFWERRARRIVPALVVVTLATLAAGWLFLLPQDLENLGQSAASQALFAANIHYWKKISYFNPFADEMPLLHTWSLAVEEQFYFIVPFLMWGLYRYRTLRNRSAVLVVLGIGFVLSFAASIYGLPRHPGATFYLLPTRAWELLTGAIVGFIPMSPTVGRTRNIRELSALIGLSCILVAVFFFDHATPFPGLAALLPCGGAALLIWSNGRSGGSAPTLVGKMFSMRPFVFIGLISYSLYLWHWPFLSFDKYLVVEPASFGHRLLLVAFGFLFGLLSWRFVETPFRKRSVAATRRSMLAIAGVGLAAVFVCGILCYYFSAFPNGSDLPTKGTKADQGKHFLRALETDNDISTGTLIPIGSSDQSMPPTLLVWGDSHSLAALPAIDQYLKERDLRGQATIGTGIVPVLGWKFISDNRVIESATIRNDTVFEYLQRTRIPNVLLIGYWERNEYHRGESHAKLNAALVATVGKLLAIGARPWVMLTVPVPSFHVPRALNSPIYSRDYIDSLRTKPQPSEQLDPDDLKLIAELKSLGCEVLDPKPAFLDATGRFYEIEKDGVPLYYDRNHITSQAAEQILLPFLRESWPLAGPATGKHRPPESVKDK